MTSFKRKATATPQKLPSSVKSSPASPTILLTSSGIPSLDDVLGGGLQLGTSIFILNPDPHSAHADLLQKYFIAQGLASNHTVHVFDSDARSLVGTCMWALGATATSVPDHTDDAGSTEQKRFKIAWRYENMQKFKTTIASESFHHEDYCRNFDLSYRIPPNNIEAFLDAGLLRFEKPCIESSRDAYDAVIQRIEDIVEASRVQMPADDLKVIRLSIPAFASPSWGNADPEKMLRFLLRLRALLRRSDSICAFITFPSHMCSDTWAGHGWIEKLGWISDACVSLTSFTADPMTASFLPFHHGLLRIHRLPTVQTMIPASDRFSNLRGLSAAAASISSGGVSENNLAFKCTRKRFVIETFHLDIDGGVSERRTTPTTTSIAIQESATERLASQQRTHRGLEQQSSVMIEVEEHVHGRDETGLKSADEKVVVTHDSREKEERRKRPKKKVGFQVDRPDVFDF